MAASFHTACVSLWENISAEFSLWIVLKSPNWSALWCFFLFNHRRTTSLWPRHYRAIKPPPLILLSTFTWVWRHWNYFQGARVAKRLLESPLILLMMSCSFLKVIIPQVEINDYGSGESRDRVSQDLIFVTSVKQDSKNWVCCHRMRIFRSCTVITVLVD